MAISGSAFVDKSWLKGIADCLKKKYGAKRVILFGSFARNEDTEDSDIDLLIISPTTEKFYQRMASVLQIVRELSIGMPLAPIVLTPEELANRLERGDQFVQEIIATGIDL
ncbi:MAG: nucleotidyltransferase domain-containing protein [Nitrospirae bacterium]|nr:nucleotidyltransferase domain-containing protein [Nitrospirota bacterium]MBI3351482.1 nucleotidyltransferase domain-containing protein [Nitrospirota bacterium]